MKCYNGPSPPPTPDPLRKYSGTLKAQKSLLVIIKTINNHPSFNIKSVEISFKREQRKQILPKWIFFRKILISAKDNCLSKKEMF